MLIGTFSVAMCHTLMSQQRLNGHSNARARVIHEMDLLEVREKHLKIRNSTPKWVHARSGSVLTLCVRTSYRL